MTNTKTPANRLQNLDVVRGLAAIAVVLFHYTTIFPNFYPAGETVDLPFDYGYYGVHLFFMVSGFVILMSLSKNKGAGFVKSRFIRLYPVYWASALLTLAVLWAAAPFSATYSASTALINLTMLQGFLKIPSIDGVYWSLTYELGFYVFLYSIYRLRLDRYIQAVPVFMAAGAALFPLVGPYIPHPLHLFVAIHDYSHLFACGLSLYLIRQNGWSKLQAAVLIAAPLIQFEYDGLIGGIICAALVLMMIWASQMAYRPNRLYKPFLWLGGISYALYLTHQMIGYVIMARLQQIGFSAEVSFVATLISVLVLAHILSTLVEKPSARWLKSINFSKIFLRGERATKKA